MKMRCTVKSTFWNCTFKNAKKNKIFKSFTIEIIINRYCSYWYVAPLRAQKFLLFIMQRTSRNFYFVFGGIFTVSLKGFSTVTNTTAKNKIILINCPKYNFAQTRYPCHWRKHKFAACKHVDILFHGHVFVRLFELIDPSAKLGIRRIPYERFRYCYRYVLDFKQIDLLCDCFTRK